MGILEYDTQCESCHNQNLVVHHAYWFSSSTQEWIVDFRATKHMIRHEKIQHPLSNYRREHIGEKVVIDDNSNLSVSGDRKSTRLNSSHTIQSRMPSSA